MARQELGPLQRKWVEALRSGEYEQGKRFLKADDAYCCLGVACIAFGIPVPSSAARLPEPVQFGMKFHSAYGLLKGDKLDGELRLDFANDYANSTFERIADFVEDHPEAVFTEPA